MKPYEMLRVCVERLELSDSNPDFARRIELVSPKPIQRHQPPYIELLCVNPRGEHVYLCDPVKVAAWVLRKFYNQP